MPRRVTAALLLAMAVGQAADLGGFVDIIATYEVGGRAVVWLIAMLLLLGELAGGTLLLTGRRRSRLDGATIAVAVAVTWTILGAQAFARGLALDNCGCFGVYLAQPLRWWVLLEDAELVLLTLWTHRRVAATPLR